MSRSIGVPVKLLHESVGHTVTVELASGEIYRGSLEDMEDNMNCRLSKVTCTSRDNKVTALEQVYIRGSKIRFFILPDMLKNAPMFRRTDTRGGRAIGTGRGRGSNVARGRGMLIDTTD
jgi:small nuclear ribonucleoprotein D3